MFDYFYLFVVYPRIFLSIRANRYVFVGVFLIVSIR
jgi:hypothetical protein